MDLENKNEIMINEEVINTELSVLPTGEEIKKVLSETPEYIAHYDGIALEFEKKKNKVKILIEAKTKKLELEKSKIRNGIIEEYKKEQIEFQKKLQKDIDKEREKGITKSALLEYIKVMRPEKPTKNELDDIANIRTEEEQNEILKWSKVLRKLEEEIAGYRIISKKYDNYRQSAISHKGLYVEEIKAGLID